MHSRLKLHTYTKEFAFVVCIHIIEECISSFNSRTNATFFEYVRLEERLIFFLVSIKYIASLSYSLCVST